MGGTRYDYLKEALEEADDDSAVDQEAAIRDIELEFPDIEDED